MANEKKALESLDEFSVDLLDYIFKFFDVKNWEDRKQLIKLMLVCKIFKEVICPRVKAVPHNYDQGLHCQRVLLEAKKIYWPSSSSAKWIFFTEGDKKTLLIWSLSLQRILQTISVGYAIQTLALTPTGDFAILFDEAKNMWLLNVVLKKTTLLNIKLSEVFFEAQLTADCKYLLFSTEEARKNIQMYDLQTGKKIYCFSHKFFIEKYQLLTQKNYLIVSGQREVNIWHIDTQCLLRSFRKKISSIFVSPHEEEIYFEKKQDKRFFRFWQPHIENRYIACYNITAGSFDEQWATYNVDESSSFFAGMVIPNLKRLLVILDTYLPQERRLFFELKVFHTETKKLLNSHVLSEKFFSPQMYLLSDGNAAIYQPNAEDYLILKFPPLYVDAHKIENESNANIFNPPVLRGL